jgi:DivIVA domain-containing protein
VADDLAPDLTANAAHRANGPGGSGALTPEDVAYRSFAGARRGVSESEVREFLQEVAAEMAAAVGRERDLIARVHELEGRLAHPPAPTEEQILDHLGEETARVLRSAQEAADEIRANASKRAQAIIEQAESEADRTRQAAEAVLGDKTREAEVAATVIQREAEGKAQADLRQAARDGEAEIAAARQRGREMVGEARAVRERILSDLGKRRASLQGEVEQLKAARTELVEAGRVAKATLGGIVGALAAFDDSAQPGTDTVPELVEFERLLEDEGPAEADASEHAEASEQGHAAEDDAAEAPDEEEAHEEEEPEEEEQAEAQEGEEEAQRVDEVVDEEADDEPAVSVRPQVEELFARIRADRTGAVDQARAVLATEPAPAPTAESELEPEPAAAVAEAPERARPEAEDVDDKNDLLLARRDELLTSVHADLVRRCKRALQDEQNELLDRLRRQKGRSTADELLIPLSVQVTDWADALEPAVDEAYGAGRSSHDGGGTTAAPRRLVSGLAELLVTPLRERLLSALDEVPTDDPERATEMTSRVGARYREWRSQELDLQVGDLLATAYTRGVYDGAPEGALLRWVPAAATRCPDCDDNALEPTPRGAPFPTGQPFPPAHPGCRCVLAVAEVE